MLSENSMKTAFSENLIAVRFLSVTVTLLVCLLLCIRAISLPRLELFELWCKRLSILWSFWAWTFFWFFVLSLFQDVPLFFSFRSHVSKPLFPLLTGVLPNNFISSKHTVTVCIHSQDHGSNNFCINWYLKFHRNSTQELLKSLRIDFTFFLGIVLIFE